MERIEQVGGYWLVKDENGEILIANEDGSAVCEYPSQLDGIKGFERVTAIHHLVLLVQDHWNHGYLVGITEGHRRATQERNEELRKALGLDGLLAEITQIVAGHSNDR